MERNYVKVSQKHTDIKGCLLFWGRYTADDSERSFGGYTNDFEKCEKYNKEDLEKDSYNHDYFENMTRNEVMSCEETFNIKISDLNKLANKKTVFEYK